MKMERVISMENRDPYFYLRYSCKCIKFFTHIYSMVLKLSLIECTTHPSPTTIPLYFNSSALQVFPACWPNIKVHELHSTACKGHCPDHRHQYRLLPPDGCRAPPRHAVRPARGVPGAEQSTVAGGEGVSALATGRLLPRGSAGATA